MRSGFALLMLVILVPLSALAQSSYRCEDRDSLERVLADLNSKCGATNATVCSSLNFKGSSVESAIDECAKNYNRASCAQSVTCSDGAPLCDSLGFKGSSATKAIVECAKSYARSSCGQSVTCQNSPLCQSLGFKGATLEDAIAECALSYSRSSCAQNASCN